MTAAWLLVAVFVTLVVLAPAVVLAALGYVALVALTVFMLVLFVGGLLDSASDYGWRHRR